MAPSPCDHAPGDVLSSGIVSPRDALQACMGFNIWNGKSVLAGLMAEKERLGWRTSLTASGVFRIFGSLGPGWML